MRRRSSPTHPFQDDSHGTRIQKVLADAGVGSRRACEAAVEEGRVTVNGHRIDGFPAWVDPATDDIRVDGRRIKASERHVYVMLFKPKGYVCTNDDPEGRPRAVDLVSHPAHARLYPVGRLDLDSSGLLLLTNDGALANRLTHPRFEMQKGYEVMVGGRVEDADVERLERGVFVPGADGRGGGRAARSHLVVLKRDAARTLLYMELHETRNREIRRVLATLGHPVRKLRRVRMGPLQLKGLQAGQWRELTSKELALLRDQAFATPQQRAARREERRPSPAARVEAAAERRAPKSAPRTPKAARLGKGGAKPAGRAGARRGYDPKPAPAKGRTSSRARQGARSDRSR